MAEQQIDATQPQAVVRRNYRLGVINGVLFTLGDTLSSAGLVLALLVRQLGGSLELIGLLPALQSGGYLLPQLLVGGRLQAMSFKMPLYRRAAGARIAAFALMTAAVFAADALPPTLSLTLIVVLYSIFNLGGGTSTLAFQDIVAKVVPPRRRGNFFGMRQLGGGLLGFAIAGPLVRWMLGDGGPLPFPTNFGLVVLLSLVAYAAGMYAFLGVAEPVQEQTGPRLRVVEGLRKAPSLLRGNHNYRWFIISRMLTRIGLIAEPFYIIYATEALGLPPSTAGIYLAIRALTGALSNLAWGRISDRRGNRTLILWNTALIALTPLTALAGPPLVGALGLGDSGMAIALGLVFLISGVALDGMNIGGWTYLMEVVPSAERPVYIGIANTALGVAAFLPVLGGWLVGLIGYQATFTIGLVFSLLGLATSLRLGESREPSSAGTQAGGPELEPTIDS